VGNIEMWSKPIMPTGSYAFGVINFGNDMPTTVTVQLASQLGFISASGYNVTEVFDGQFIGTFKPSSNFTVSVNPNGVFFGKAIALP